MFIVTTKISGKRLLCGAAVLAAVLLGLHVTAQFSEEVTAMGAAIGSAIQSDEQSEPSDRVTTNEERVNYLAACGWIVDANSCVMQEVIIPSSFDETYQAYADLQAQQGFDLEKYRGKRVKLTTYTVENSSDGVQLEANLLIRKNRVIAGDITSLSDGGTAYGLMDAALQSGGSASE